MEIAIYLDTLSFIYLLIIGMIYFTKKRVNNIDNSIFSILIIYTAISIIIEILLFILTHGSSLNFLSYLLLKTQNVLILGWIILFGVYAFVVSKKDEYSDDEIKKIYRKPLISIRWIFAVSVLIIYALPLYVTKGINVNYAEGLSFDFLILMSSITVSLVIMILIKNYKKISNKTYYPVIFFVLLIGVTVLVEKFYPEILLINLVQTIIIFLMFHTIENPDIKTISELNVARNNAVKANNAKSDFLSSMSHEIRTPLNAIVGLSTYLSEQNDIPKKYKEDTTDIVNASQTLLDIVGNILDINKIETNKMTVTAVPYSIKEELTNILKINKGRIKEKELEVIVDISKDIPDLLLGDKIHVKSILNNLISNASKYTESGTIKIKLKAINNLEKMKTSLIITVEDTGRGIKVEDIKKLFEKFERIEVEKNSTTEGTGLGLAITKQLVELMNGTINVNSNYGEGTLFTVTLPQIIHKFNKEINEEEIDILDFESTTDKLFGDKRILIVDDNKINIKVAKKMLEGFNFTIEECYNGIECLEKVKIGNEYDLILMDIMMPLMDGVETLKKLKEKELFSIPTIALTADAIAGAENKYLAEGFVNYIAKPMTKDKLVEVIKEIV